MRLERRAAESPSRLPAPARATTLDFDVGGVLLVRALDAAPADEGLLCRQLGPVQTTTRPERRPDLVVCFVDDMASTDLDPIEGGSMAFGDGGLYCLSDSGRPIAHIKRGEGWGRVIIVCRRGLKRVPCLSDAVDLAALARGWIPLHASGWVYEGIGFVATGGAGSGKTGALLAACCRGAVPLGDDRILLSADGRTMIGLGNSISLRDWHQTQLDLPEVRIGNARRTLAKLGTTLGRAAAPLGATRRAGGSVASLITRIVDGIRRRLGVEVVLERLGNDGGLRARPDVLIVLEKRPGHGVSAERIDRRAAVTRIAAEVEADLRPALGEHLATRSLGRASEWRNVHRAPEVAALLLNEAVRRKPAYVITHSPECPLNILHDVMAALPRGDFPFASSAGGSSGADGAPWQAMPIRRVHA